MTNESVLLLLFFVGIISITILLLVIVLLERERLERTLKKQEGAEKFLAVTETASDAIVCADSFGKIVYFNKAAKQIFGHSPEEVMGQPLTLLMPCRYQEAHLKGLACFRMTGESRVMGRTVELTGKKRDGSEFPIGLSLAHWKVKENIFFSAIIRDLTEQKRTEQALQNARDDLEIRVAQRTEELKKANAQLEKLNEIKSNFILTASHELRHPLTSIKGYIMLLLYEKAGVLTAKQQEFLTHVRKATDLLTRLLSDLLHISKLETGQACIHKEAVPIAELLEEQVSIFKAEAGLKQIDLELGLESALGTVLGDADRIREVIGNLISNSLKFTFPGGKIRILAVRHDSRLEIEFRDTGIGIAAQDQERIFDPFHRGYKKGLGGEENTGLGLALTKKIVEAHGGEIRVESQEGVGSVFRVILPACLEMEAPSSLSGLRPQYSKTS